MLLSTRGMAAAGFGFLFSASVLATASDPYGPPEDYYQTLQYDGTPDSLRSGLNAIIDGHTIRSYGAARQALAILDRDPDNPNNIILMYNGASVSGSWDSGATWNREHMWPRSLGVGDNGADYSDLHALRPCNPSINSSRGNKPFGLANSAYWDPTMGNAPFGFRGEAARSIFYMEVRYDGGDSATTDLRVVDGFPSGAEMGDLSYLLDWHYDEAPSARERRRNHLVFSFEDNPLYAQGNRNPFVDRPEFAWAIWGDQPNDSQIVIDGAVSGSAGASLLDIDLGRFILAPDVEDALTQAVVIEKTGGTPTSFLVEASGDVFSADHAIPGTFSRGTRTAVVDAALWSPLPGELSGQLSVLNTDLTSAGVGLGSADGIDIVTISGFGVNPSIASFSPTVGQTTLSIDLGTMPRSIDDESTLAPVFNAGGAAATTAALLLTGFDGEGDTGFISIQEFPQAPVAGGDIALIDLSVGRDGPIGSYQAVYTIATADEAIPGAMQGQILTLTISVQLEASDCAADADGDGTIGLSDLNAVLAGFGQTSGATLSDGDVSGDGAVGLDDLNIVLAAFGSSCP
jgi:endonuclease I